MLTVSLCSCARIISIMNIFPFLVDPNGPLPPTTSFPQHHPPLLTPNGHIAGPNTRLPSDNISQEYYTWGYEHR